MANQTKIIVAGLIAILCVALVWSLSRPDTIVYEASEPSLGALAGPDIISPYISWGDVPTYRGREEVLTATSTICAIQSPTATSTLTLGAVKLTTSSTTASIIHLAKASTAFATTTSLGFYNLAAGAQGTLIASSTTNNVAGGSGDALDQNHVFAPSQWFVVGFMQTGAGSGQVTGLAPAGTCTAEWTVL